MTNETDAFIDTQYKAMQGQVNIDEAQGIVECFVAGLGNKDSVGDICLPGAFTESLKRRKPRVVWGHNWNEPIGKVLEIYEVPPSDPRLPLKMKRAGIGGLYAKVQFNLKSERGRQAFADVAFFGEEQEWSIGYKTLNADYDSQRQANLLREVELYEVSPVLHGANQLTGTISIKGDQPLKDPEGGLTAAGRRFYKETEGANLKPGVRGAADTPQKMRRKGSFLTRFFTNPSGPMKDENGKPTRLALSAAAWGEPVPQNMEDAAKLAAKGRKLLEKYAATKEKAYADLEKIYEVSDDEGDDADYMGPRGEDGGVPAMNPAMGRVGNLARALAMRFGGAVRLRSADPNLVVFDHMDENKVKRTLRVSYHFDGDEFMFGNPSEVRPETVYLPVRDDVNGSIDSGDENGEDNEAPFMQQYMDDMEDYPAMPAGMKPKVCGCKSCNPEKKEDDMHNSFQDGIKAPIPPDAIPQERITGDVLRGYGPRRGNLEQLLRYWRPIMRREGGFRRCRVILANHPELYPLNNICAWLHHETTGLWPNEGCHHPGMKNCRRKIRGVVNGSIWDNNEWNDRLSRLAPDKGKGLGMDEYEEDDMNSMSPAQVEEKAMYRLKEFLDAQPEFVKFIEDNDNWVHEGDDEDNSPTIHVMVGEDGMPKKGCGCGCGGGGGCGSGSSALSGVMAALAQLGKSFDEEVSTKSGRVISNRNMQKLRQAMTLLEDVVAASAPTEPAVQVKSDGSIRLVSTIDTVTELKSFIDPILNYHGLDAHIDGAGIYLGSVVSTEAKSAMINAVSAYKELWNKKNH